MNKLYPHCLELKVCTQGVSVFQPDHIITQGVFAFWTDHIFGYDSLPEQPCCWIKNLSTGRRRSRESKVTYRLDYQPKVHT